MDMQQQTESLTGFVSQILITEKPEPLPPYLEYTTSLVREFAQGQRYTLFGAEDLRALIETCFDRSLVEVYDGLVPFAYKSDLGRLCILYAFGGWYIDLSIHLQNPRPLSTNAASIFFRDLNKFTQSSWAVINGLVYSEANNPVFLSAIEMIIQNYKHRYYGMTPFCPTGPNLFGRAIAKHGLMPRMSFGDYVEMTPHHSHKNFAFLLPNGEIFAYPKSSGPGDLQQLGLKTGNNYVDLWKRKQIYR